MEEKYVLLTFSTHSQTLKMGCGEVLKINSLEGFTAPPYTFHTQPNATGDGTTKTGERVEERLLKIGFTIDNLLNPELVRRKLIQFFNPKYPVKLTTNYMNNVRWIEGLVYSFKPANPEASMYDYQKYQLELLCPDPFWNDPDNYGKNIASITPMWTYPLSFTAFNRNRASRLSTQVAGYKSLTQEVTLKNKGDVPTGLQIRFIAKRGVVINPKIINTVSGEYIEVIHEMKMGDVITINTNSGKKGITLLKAGETEPINIFKEKDKNSVFFGLELGDNKIKYEAEDGYTNLDVRVYYVPQYLGV